MKKRGFVKIIGKEGDPEFHDTAEAIAERKKYLKSSNKAYDVAIEYQLDRCYNQIEVYWSYVTGEVDLKSMYDCIFPKGGGSGWNSEEFKAWLERHYKDWFKACLDKGLVIDACEDLIKKFVTFTDMDDLYFKGCRGYAKKNFIKCLELWNESFS